jgi:hypothetical protein
MVVIASQSGGASPGFIALLVIFLIGYVGYKAHLYFCRPETWAALQKHKLEQKLAAEAARRESRNKLLGGIAGGVARVVLGAVIKGRPHH